MQKVKATKLVNRLHHVEILCKLAISMFSQPSEISDFRLRREVIITRINLECKPYL